MKRRTKHGIISALVLILLFSPSGCSSRKLEYHGNLGYDLSNIDYEEVVFNIYHSNTEQHTWEKLTEFLCSPEKGTMQISGWRAVKTGSPQLSKIIMSQKKMILKLSIQKTSTVMNFQLMDFRAL